MIRKAGLNISIKLFNERQIKTAMSQWSDQQYGTHIAIFCTTLC